MNDKTNIKTATSEEINARYIEKYSEYRAHFSMSLPEYLLRKLDDFARRESRSRSNFVRKIVENLEY